MDFHKETCPVISTAKIRLTSIHLFLSSQLTSTLNHRIPLLIHETAFQQGILASILVTPLHQNQFSETLTIPKYLSDYVTSFT